MSVQSSLRQRGVYETRGDSLLKYILLQYQVVTRALVQLIQARCFAHFPLPCRL